MKTKERVQKSQNSEQEMRDAKKRREHDMYQHEVYM